MLVLSGDLGATKFTLVLSEGGRVVARETYRCGDYPGGAADVVAAFLSSPAARARAERPGFLVERACVGVAGPVEGGRCAMTNIPSWPVLDERELASRFGVKEFRLVNDLRAQAWAVWAHLQDQDPAPFEKAEVKPGEASPSLRPVAVLGLGTGLGMSILQPVDGRLRPRDSEGGHAGFAPRGQLQRELHAHLEAWLRAPVTMERVLSGQGLWNLYDFLRHRHPTLERAEVREEAEAAPPARRPDVIGRWASEGDPLSRDAVALLWDLCAQQAADLALRDLALGGVYVCGGVARKNLSLLDRRRFRTVFEATGASEGIRAILRRTPVWVIEEEDLGEMGARLHATRSWDLGP